MDKKLKKIISKILNISINKITNKFEPKFEKKWDSINNIKILLEVEKYFKIRFQEEDFHKKMNFIELLKQIKIKLNAKKKKNYKKL